MLPTILRRISRMIRPSRVRSRRNAQLLAMAVELFGEVKSVLPSSPRRRAERIAVAVPRASPVQAPDRCVQELGVGRQADGFGTHRCVDQDFAM
jgi:hypothetical protein